jgi:hypothetical protein
VTGEFKITNRIDGWNALVAINEEMEVRVGNTIHAPLGKGKDRKRRLSALRGAYHSLWREANLWNRDMKPSDAAYRNPVFKVL